TSAEMEELVLAVRDEHPAWGGRKIRRRLQDLGRHGVPSASTVTAVLHRHGRIDAAASVQHQPFERFERAAPNELWQMDYKGHFATAAGRLELGVAVSHGRPYHPQTPGKDERFHRTLTAEVIGRRAFADLAQCQQRFDAWRVVYNTQRPHEALALATPAARYRPSGRGFPEKIEPFDYGPGAIVRRVDGDGWLSFRNRPLKVGRAFSYRRVALRPTDQDGCFDVLFCAQKVGALDLPEAAP